MSLRCSLLGHEYGESEIERDREERGDEVVLSVTELERCTRCGNARIISENTEVTQRSPSRGDDAPEIAAEPASEPDSRGSLSGANAAVSSTAEARSDAGFGDDRNADFGADANADVNAEAGGAELLETDEGDDRPPRESGSWPDHDGGSAAGTSREWPSIEGDDEGFDASVPDGESTIVEFGGGLTPRADQGAEILEAEGTRDEGDDVEFVRSEASLAPERPVEIEGETELYCPGCDASDLDDRESLRAGDICPVCRRGYLAEREL